FFFFSSRRRHTRWPRDWSSDVCSSDLRRPRGHARDQLLRTIEQSCPRRWHARIAQREIPIPAGPCPSKQQENCGAPEPGAAPLEIGRASCRERGEVWVVGGRWK